MITFLVALALGIGALAAVPWVAHFYRRGRTKTVDFAAVRFLVQSPPLAKQKSRLDDRALLAVRVGQVLLLALLGSTPLIRGGRPLLARDQGGSVGRVVVLDDSGSMNARLPDGATRFERARQSALELVEQMRKGDSFGIVLASKPARLHLAPTGQQETVRQELLALSPTSRPTDVSAALGLGRAVLEHLPQADRQILLLSDLGAGELTLAEDTTFVLPVLRTPVVDCAVLSALRQREQVQIDYACSKASPASKRTLALVEEKSPDRVHAKATVAQDREGRTTVAFDSSLLGGIGPLAVRFLEPDDNGTNDQSPLITEEFGISIGSYSDPSTGRAATGGPPVIEQALRALDPNIALHPLATVPDDPKQLRALGVLILDDPPPFSAESRVAITHFAEHGGTAVALLGPGAASVQLGHLHLPFLEQPATWQTQAPAGLETESLEATLFGAESLSHLGAKGRLSFDVSPGANLVVRARWSDQVPFWIERALGRGKLCTLGLPSSVEWSDLALRPGFLSLLKDLVTSRDRRGQGRVVVAGSRFEFPTPGAVNVTLPDGSSRAVADATRGAREFVADHVGRYVIDWSGDREERLVLWPAEETLDVAKTPIVTAARKANQTTGRIDTTRFLAVGLLCLLVLDIILRRIAPSEARKWLIGRFARIRRDDRERA